MPSINEQDVLDALRTVTDAERGGDIVSLGMVSGVAIRHGNVGFSIEVEPERGARLEPLRKAAETAVMHLPGVTSVTAVLTAERPAPKAPAPSAGASTANVMAARRQAATGHAPAKKPLVPGVKYILAVASGKGGVGKSTVAVNLALALSAAGHKIGILDADIYGPSQPRMLGIKGRPETTPDTMPSDTISPPRSASVTVRSASRTSCSLIEGILENRLLNPTYAVHAGEARCVIGQAVI
jgi:ATP-binding protein involved in chromosome partitioning